MYLLVARNRVSAAVIGQSFVAASDALMRAMKLSDCYDWIVVCGSNFELRYSRPGLPESVRKELVELLRTGAVEARPSRGPIYKSRA